MKRKLGIDRNHMYALIYKEGNATTNAGKIVEIAEEFYRDLCSSRHSLDDNGKLGGPDEFDIPPVTTAKLKKSLQAMKGGKAASGDQVTADLLRQLAASSSKTGDPLYSVPHDLERIVILE